MRFLCTNCGHIYDESQGDLDEGIDPGTCIDEFGEDQHCPACDGSYDNYSPIEDEVLYADDPENLSHIEREHIPYVTHLDDNKVELTVGIEPHVTGDDHRITAVYLVDEEGHIVEEIFILPDEDPVAEFDISEVDDFELRASCSIHGLWSTGIIQREE